MSQGKPDDIPQDVWDAARSTYEELFRIGAFRGAGVVVDPQATIARAIMAERERCVGKWLPIESAPKDRTAIIVAVPDKDRASFHVGEAYFDPETGDWWWAGIDWSDYHTGPISEVNFHLPTHWMPLPPPPNGEVRG